MVARKISTTQRRHGGKGTEGQLPFIELRDCGGDASLAPYLQTDLSAWIASISDKPTLTTFKLAPLSVFVEDQALASALENATSTYIKSATS